MKTVIHKADTRGHADHGWLKTNHSFSFASYFNPDKMGFGLLRVLNDDFVAPSKGFATHPHQNMEIVSIPLSGSLEHKDSEGNQTVIRSGEVQIMSAGTGVMHSEYNASDSEEVNFLQIWVQPEELNIKPRYDQKRFSPESKKDQFQIIVSPIGSDHDGIKINQNAYFSLVDISPENKLTYHLYLQGNGIYLFLLEGELEVEGQQLKKRDAIGLTDIDSFSIRAIHSSEVLLIEVPLV